MPNLVISDFQVSNVAALYADGKTIEAYYRISTMIGADALAQAFLDVKSLNSFYEDQEQTYSILFDLKCRLWITMRDEIEKESFFKVYDAVGRFDVS